jgi:anti-anti-sigma factor
MGRETALRLIAAVSSGSSPIWLTGQYHFRRLGRCAEGESAVAMSDGGSSGDRGRVGGAGEPEPSLTVQDVVSGGWHTLRLCGEVDLAAGDLLDDVIEQVCQVAIDGVVLDLSEVSFIDSTGVRAVLELRKRCQRQGAELRIVGSSAVRRVFEISGLLDRLPFVADGSSG